MIDETKAYYSVGEMMGALEQALGKFDTGQIF